MGKLDIVFANAGIMTLTTLGTITEADYDSLFNANVKGVLFTAAGGTSAPDEGGIDHPECVHRGQQGIAELERL
jgi:hypothetical protein